MNKLTRVLLFASLAALPLVSVADVAPEPFERWREAKYRREAKYNLWEPADVASKHVLHSPFKWDTSDRGGMANSWFYAGVACLAIWFMFGIPHKARGCLRTNLSLLAAVSFLAVVSSHHNLHPKLAEVVVNCLFFTEAIASLVLLFIWIKRGLGSYYGRLLFCCVLLLVTTGASIDEIECKKLNDDMNMSRGQWIGKV